MSLTVIRGTTKSDPRGLQRRIDPKLLRWRPPVQSNPTIVTVPQGFYSGSFGPTEDVIFNWPASVRFSEFISTGGRHLRIIGGASTKGAGGSAIQITACSGSVFLEGLAIDTSAASIDAINACGSGDGSATLQPDMYIQNCRIVGVNGANAGVHADVFQAQGAIKNLYIDNVTLSSNYQGISIFQSQFPFVSGFLSRINGFYTAVAGDPFTSLMWNMDQATHAPYFPVDLDQIYFVPRSTQSLSDCAWPQPGITNSDGIAIGGILSPDGTKLSWPAINNTQGFVSLGPPPGGDFVPSSFSGINYVSPGYR